MPKSRISNCRACRGTLDQVLLDLGETPPSNSFLTEADLARPERRFRLCARVCSDCRLVQIDETVPPSEIFTADYAYYSSYSTTWVEHARRFAESATARFGLGPDSLVVEVASNDGYLLRHFVALGIPVLGIEPSGNVADVARERGVPTLTQFFNLQTAKELVRKGQRAELLVGNNVLAHVPELNDFVAGLAEALAPEGVVSLEFPHLLRLMEGLQFDTIYHEHYFYFSLLAAERVLDAHGLKAVEVEELSTHGGSLRLYAQRRAARPRLPGTGLDKVRQDEARAGLDSSECYAAFGPKVSRLTAEIRAFLEEAKQAGKTIAAYGAAAKGNTLLNACGIGPGLIDYVVDRNPHKQGRFTPGSHLPVYATDRLEETRPDYVLILPWNLADEIVGQFPQVRAWGGRFVVPVPKVRILD